MTEDELRALVRGAIARHLREEIESAPPDFSPGSGGPVPVPLWRSHPSFGKFLVPSGLDLDGPCLIEPTVRCHHCGYCQSYGH